MSPAGALGRPRIHLRVTDSTNERAKDLAARGAPHGTLVTTSQQTAGRGRQGRRWSAPAGSSLLMSLVLHSPPTLLPLASALAVSDVAGPEALIKWPNDIVVRQREDGTLGKLAGILVEGRPQAGWAVLGIGLNVAVDLDELPVELRPGSREPDARPAASMGRDPSEVEPLLRELLAALEARLAAGDEQVLEDWRSRDALLGREVSWSEGSGQAAGIDGLGRLVVELPGGGHTALGAGEVHLRGLG
ncbi:MAG TPA: biotin--[acetyl-CoA-carboxylase] ligase [Solirubrobacteraceae bacterium]|jgi:BirA family biotin operon repressor/biotin-[acetyl-CoA-carboxylase] ligase